MNTSHDRLDDPDGLICRSCGCPLPPDEVCLVNVDGESNPRYYCVKCYDLLTGLPGGLH